MAVGTTRATAEKLLRIRYAKKLHRLYPIHSLLAQMFAPLTKKVAIGEKFALHLDTSMGSGYMASNAGLLPPAYTPEPEKAYFKLKFLTNRVEIMADFEEDAADVDASPTSPLEMSINAVGRNHGHDYNFDLYRDGSCILTDLDGSPAATATSFKVKSTRGLRKGLWVDVVLKASGSAGAGGVKQARITVNHKTKVVTLLEGKTLVDGSGAELNANPTLYAVYRAGSFNDGFFGLQAMISDANPPTGVGLYGDIDRTVSTNSFWHGVVHANGAVLRVPSMKLMQDVIDEIQINSAGVVNVIICENQVWDYLVEKLLLSKRYAGETMKLRGWADAVQFASLPGPIVKDPHCPPSEMFFLDTTQIQVAQTHPGKWMDKDGAILARLPDRVGYGANWYRRCQLITPNPAAHGRLSDLKYDTPS